MSADELVAQLRRIARERLGSDVLAQVEQAERNSKCRITVYESPTGEIVFVGHAGDEPTPEALRKAAQACLLRRVAARGHA